MKARLIVRDYEEDSHNLKIDSLTCSHETIHIVMLTALIIKWWVQSLDFTSAFLQGDKLERKIFLRPLLTYVQSHRYGRWKDAFMG